MANHLLFSPILKPNTVQTQSRDSEKQEMLRKAANSWMSTCFSLTSSRFRFKVLSLNTFRNLLKERGMYEFRGIDVAGSNSHVKVSDAPVSICFTGHTSFVEVTEPTAAGVQEPHDCDLPQCLEEIIGSTLTFQLNLPHFNFTAKHQSFTVSCILDHNQRPPQRNFEVHHTVNDGNRVGNGDVEGGRGDASDPRDNSVDGSSTGEGAPVEEDWCSAEKTHNE
ncbi:hypothetical protein Bca101_072207 [Brassica carinata]